MLLLHGSSAIKIITIITINFVIGRVFRGSTWNPFCTWTFNLAILFLNEYYDGYRFQAMFGPSFGWLDEFEGFQARWHILFNFAMLRLVSFNLDYFWACRSSEKKESYGHSEAMSDKERTVLPWNIETDYSYLDCLTYVLYTPLLLCGPIITYNDFISQVSSRKEKFFFD